MKKIFYCLITAIFLSSCAPQEISYFEPDYNGIAEYVIVVDKSSNFVVYEYSDIRIDEIAQIAAIYCHDHGDKQASLYEINLTPDSKRRATFVCR